jgi:hypothetical protein
MENLKKWNKNYLKKSIEERREIREKNAWEATLP